MKCRTGFSAFAAGLLLCAGQAKAFVTSATLEYSFTHGTKFYLNGVEIKNEATQYRHVLEYGLMCSADGSLPLELFKYKTENILAIIQKGTGGWHEFSNMGVSYRLTVYQSAGAPIVVWSEPGNTKYLHLDPGGQPPAGWQKPGFDDSKWKEGVSARMITDYWGWPELPDPQFSGLFGAEGHVPFLSHNKAGNASADMTNLFRSNFRLPDKPGKLVVYPYTPKAKQGDKVMVRMIPARDCASMGDLQVSAILPRGLDPAQAQGASFDQASRKLSWRYASPAKSLTTNIQSVIENHGFVQPEKVIGPWKPNRPPKDYIRNMTQSEYWDSSSFPSGASAWFKMTAPPFADSPTAPIILSVTLQSQIFPEGYNGLISYSVEHIMLNYSVDGSLKGAKPGDGKSIETTMGGGSGQYWSNGYLDVTYDRHWTWSDLQNLRVRFFAKQVDYRKLENRLLSCVATVRYYDPKDVAPFFYATVSEASCKDLTITATLASLVNDSSASATGLISANLSLCAPTPRPTATTIPTRVPTPRPGVTPPTPMPTATPGLAFVGQKPGIKEVSNAPEPFRRSGCFVYFTLGGSVTSLTFNVYDAGNKVIAQMDAGAFGPGKNQLFYNGLTTGNKSLPPGHYTYELVGKVGSYLESFRSSFTKESDKYK